VRHVVPNVQGNTLCALNAVRVFLNNLLLSLISGTRTEEVQSPQVQTYNSIAVFIKLLSVPLRQFLYLGGEVCGNSFVDAHNVEVAVGMMDHLTEPLDKIV
jgi:hypothetical protein